MAPVPYGKRRSVVTILKLLGGLALGTGNSLLHVVLWLLFPSRRLLSLKLYALSAFTRKVFGNVESDELQVTLGIHRLEDELQSPLYRKFQHKNQFGVPFKPTSKMVWIYEVPNRQPQDPVVYYLHGGAFNLTTGLPQVFWTHELAERLSSSRVSVLALDYSIAPYAKYPVQLDEAIQGYNDLAATCNKVIILGDSAGGTLATALVMKFRESGTPEPFGVVLVSPWVSLIPSYRGSSGPANRQNDWITTGFGVTSAERYTGSKIVKGRFLPPVDKYADVAQATKEDLVFPKNTCCAWGTHELLSDPITEFVARSNIVDVCEESGIVHDICCFGHNNLSSAFISTEIIKWLTKS